MQPRRGFPHATITLPHPKGLIVMRTIVYISGALSDVPAQTRDHYLTFYEMLGQVVETAGLVAYVPHQNTDPVRHKDVTPKQVDLIDRTAVMSSILVAAVVDNPSLGVGIEVEMAYHAAKPVVLLCHEDRIAQRRISRLVRGNPAVVHEIVYTTREDALEQFAEFLRTFLMEQAEGILPRSLQPLI